jgi:hypothetical protein
VPLCVSECVIVQVKKTKRRREEGAAAASAVNPFQRTLDKKKRMSESQLRFAYN